MRPLEPIPDRPTMLKGFMSDIPFSPKTKDCEHSWEKVESAVLEMPHEKKFVLVVKCAFCGLIDKTVEVTSKQPDPPPPPKGECRHKWVVDKSVELESAYEQMIEGAKPKRASKLPIPTRIDLDLNKAPKWMFRKGFATIRTCANCGEIDKTIAYNISESEEEEGNDSG